MKKSKYGLKRHLDLNGLKTGQFGVVATINVEGAGHPVKFSTAIQALQQAHADLKRARPNFTHADVVIDFPSSVPLKLVVPATPQGAFPLEPRDKENFDYSHHGAPVPEIQPNMPDRVGASVNIRQLENSALAEAEQLAAAAAKISMGALDVGNDVAARLEKHGLMMEHISEELSNSPDEGVSRKICARARGPEQHVQYPAGERSIGGGRTISTESRSRNAYKLTKCSVTPADRGRMLVLESSPHDTEWQRLQEDFRGINLLGGTEGSSLMQILRYAALACVSVNLEVCVSERIESKRRRLEAVRIFNTKEIISLAHERLNFLEETCDE
jgi:hypothetical protein